MQFLGAPLRISFVCLQLFMKTVKTEYSQKRSSSILLVLIFAGEAIYFLPFVLARIFRPTLLDVFDISNTELGSYFSVYGIVAMVSYIFGGTIADRFPARNLMALSLWLTSAGGFVMTMLPSTNIMYLLYGFWGFSTIFLFWAALIRTTREWGGPLHQGRAFGWLEGGRGSVAALLGSISFLVFVWFAPDEVENLTSGNRESFRVVILVISILTAISGILIWLFIPVKRTLEKRESFKLSYQRITELIRNPAIWLLSIIIICAYVGYKITDDFSLYAREILGFSEVGAAGIGTLALWLRAVVAICVGYIGDKINRSKVIQFSFSLTFVTALLTGLGLLTHITSLIIFNIALTAVGIYALRSLYFALMEDAKIPLRITGSAVGLVSFIGFTPDIFMGPWMGYMLDKNPGIVGHQNVFITLAGFALVGMIATGFFRSLQK
jgi:MFS family permease